MKTDIRINSTKAEYIQPEIETVSLIQEGVICSSQTEDYKDGGYIW